MYKIKYNGQYIYILILYISIILYLFIGMFTLFNKNCRVSNTRDRSI